MFATLANTQQTTQLWMWKMEYLHHEQRPLYFVERFERSAVSDPAKLSSGNE